MSVEELVATRRTHTTVLQGPQRDDQPLPEPDPRYFRLVSYQSSLGPMQAYLGLAPATTEKSPGIVWISGGFPPGGMDESAWRPVSPANDQSAKAYREAGLVMMYPTFRGAAGNPGVQEMFLGEVDDAIAAVEFLRAVPYVDPERVYVGGHSTGGTLSLLVAAMVGTNVRGVIAFGPVADPADYSGVRLPYATNNRTERMIRAPIEYLPSIRVPTLIIEGARGNAAALGRLQQRSRNELLRFSVVAGASHFDVLQPLNELLARRLVGPDWPNALDLAPDEAQRAFETRRR